jgi:hypothetical protein
MLQQHVLVCSWSVQLSQHTTAQQQKALSSCVGSGLSDCAPAPNATEIALTSTGLLCGYTAGDSLFTYSRSISSVVKYGVPGR